MITGTVFNQLGLNGVVFTQQPSEHHWIQKEPIGVDGNGVEVLPAVRQYELKWDLVDTDIWDEMYNYYLAQGVTGSLVATLPKWGASPYQFYSYSGAIMREMSYEGWFQNYYQGVKMILVKILT